MEWRDQTMPHEVEVQMVDPSNLDVVRGILDGVALSGTSLSADYYTDARTSGKIRVVGDGYIQDSLLRIVLRYPDWERELGTYKVGDDSLTRQNGVWVHDYRLQSRLFALSKQTNGYWYIRAGASAMHEAKNACDWAGYECDIQGNDAITQSNVYFESDSNRVEHLMSLCGMANNRLDVDGHGVVTIRKYVEPSDRPATFSIDLADAMGIAHDGIKLQSDFYSMPNRVFVSYRWSEQAGGETVQREVLGSADALGGLSPQSRGYLVTDFRTVDNLNPPTAQAATAMAQDIASRIRESAEWQLSIQYLPIWEGDTVDLIVHDGPERYIGKRHCLVKSLDLNLEYMTMKLTLKEV